MGIFDSLFSSRRSHVHSHIAPMLAMMLIDGDTSEDEKRVVAMRLAELGVSPAEFERLLRNPPEFVLPSTKDERQRALLEVCLVMLADGKVDPRELALFAALSRRFELSPHEAAACLNAAKELMSTLKPGANLDAELARAAARLC